MGDMTHEPEPIPTATAGSPKHSDDDKGIVDGGSSEGTDEDALQASLTVLASLSHLSTSQPLPLQSAQSQQQKQQEADATVTDLIWDCLTMKNRNNSDQGSSSKLDNNAWFVEWTRMGTLIRPKSSGGKLSPFQIHAIASHALPFDATEAPSTANWTTTGLRLSPLSADILFRTTCLMLCCYALSQCTDPENADTPTTTTTTTKTHWRRWKSLLFETMHHFQSRFVSFENGLDSKALASLSTNLLCHFLIPNMWRVRRPLLVTKGHRLHTSNGSHPDCNLAAATVAGAVAILTHHLKQYHCSDLPPDYHGVSTNPSTPQSHLDHKLVRKVLESMYWVMDGRLDLVWCQPWRTKHRIQKQRTVGTLEEETCTFPFALSYWCCWNNQDMDDDNDEQQHENYAVDYVCHVRTVWDSMAIAIAAAYGYHHHHHDNPATNHNYFDCRPCVWHPSYSWHLFFPHIPILLEDEDQIHCQTAAFQLLKSLLEATPPASLTLNGTIASPHNNIASTTNSHNQSWTLSSGGRPNHPVVQTFQLLSNHILHSNAMAKQENANSTMAHPANRSVVTPRLPDGASCFALFMRPLLSRYIPINQVSLVQHLVKTCPQPGMKAKLLDLLRTFAYWKDDDSNSEDGNITTTRFSGGQIAVWKVLDQQWGEIMEACFPPTATTTESPSPQRWSSTNGWFQLLDHVELAVSILSMVRLWNLVVVVQHHQNHSPSMIPGPLHNLKGERLQEFHKSLQATLRKWTTTTTANTASSSLPSTGSDNSRRSRPNDYHRLNLLESTLDQVIPFLV